MQHQNTDELYHYGRLGMKWGQHIFGEKFVNKSLKQLYLNSRVKRIKKKRNKLFEF